MPARPTHLYGMDATACVVFAASPNRPPERLSGRSVIGDLLPYPLAGLGTPASSGADTADAGLALLPNTAQQVITLRPAARAVCLLGGQQRRRRG
jgi:hypothetical protein